MYVLVAYDVNTETKEGRRRLRKVAKCSLDIAQLVQNSIFELSVSNAEWADCKHRLEKTVDEELDSLRYYFLGSDWRRRVETYGVQKSFDIEGPLFA